MSRIGKMPVAIPDRVTVQIKGSTVTVEGPLGKLERKLNNGISAELDEAKRQVLLKRASESKPHRMLHGLERSLVNNMVLGVTKGYRKELEIVGIGYSVKAEGNAVVLDVGFSNAVRMPVTQGIKIEVLQATNPGKLGISGADKQMVGQFAASLRGVRPPEPYQGKGIKYSDEVVRRKAGKAFVGAGG